MLGEKMWSDTEEDVYEWKYTCPKCVMHQEGLATENEALSFILNACGKLCSIKRKHEKFLSTMASAAEAFPAMAETRKGGVRRLVMFTLTVKDLSDLWSPLMEFLLRKKAQVNKRTEALSEHARLADELKATTDPQRAIQLLEELEGMDLHTACLAFASEVDQDKYLLASSYSDEWCRQVAPSGEVIGYKRSWYVCEGNTGWGRCKGLAESKAWGRRFEDPLATKQRWNCKFCNGRYKTKYGQLVEVLCPSDDTRYYFKASVPDWDHQDVRAMDHEKRLAPKSAKGLYDAMESLVPASGLMISEMITDPAAFWSGTVTPGHYMILGDMESLPKFEWDEIFNFVP